jgi:hypothetical protein
MIMIMVCSISTRLSNDSGDMRYVRWNKLTLCVLIDGFLELKTIAVRSKRPAGATPQHQQDPQSQYL